MKANSKKTTQTTTGYFQGDAIHHTGNTEVIYGGVFHEAIVLEGHKKGQTVWVVK